MAVPEYPYNVARIDADVPLTTVKLLGRGAYGEVFLARTPNGREVAVKKDTNVLTEGVNVIEVDVIIRGIS